MDVSQRTSPREGRRAGCAPSSEQLGDRLSRGLPVSDFTAEVLGLHPAAGRHRDAA